MKTIPIAEMIAEGGRDGAVEAADGEFRVRLSSDGEAASVTPEHLFAGAYGACFLDELMKAAARAHVALRGVTLMARAHLDGERGPGKLSVELRAAMPGVSESDAQHIMNLAHQTCPYSNATRGNINVSLAFD